MCDVLEPVRHLSGVHDHGAEDADLLQRKLPRPWCVLLHLLDVQVLPVQLHERLHATLRDYELHERRDPEPLLLQHDAVHFPRHGR